jgi:hypothetical protein
MRITTKAPGRRCIALTASAHAQHLAGAGRPVDREVVLRVHQALVQRLEAGRFAQHAVHRPLVAHREQRMRRFAQLAERGVVGHQPAQVDALLSGADLAADDVHRDLQAPMCSTSSRREPRRRCSQT